MILRRITEHVKAQNWTAIGIDFVIVVVGVFVGIQVANWNDDRQQAARQANYLERLRVDFVGIRDRIDEHFVIYRDTVDGSDLILSLMRADEQALKDIAFDSDQMARAFNGLLQNRIPPPLPATYVEMRSEGQLSHIRNPELRDLLADYDRLLGVLQEVARTVGDAIVQQAPVVQRHFVSRTVNDDDALSGFRNELLAFDLAGMRSDRDFTVAVSVLQRNAVNSRNLRQRQIDLIERILVLIEKESQT
jgi:hypothetical protein